MSLVSTLAKVAIGVAIAKGVSHVAKNGLPGAGSTTAADPGTGRSYAPDTSPACFELCSIREIKLDFSVAASTLATSSLCCIVQAFRSSELSAENCDFNSGFLPKTR